MDKLNSLNSRVENALLLCIFMTTIYRMIGVNGELALGIPEGYHLNTKHRKLAEVLESLVKPDFAMPRDKKSPR
ncbi:hypothetical protein CANARDRAFT_175974 [[Candida] arabinofermentans NRRL YB-2248]|uniref:Uncharacterized protein n=1 Tax=[Candida] arabinofermentans NRRL YB-2248 TaxID=983967 RepID=A0A1E4T1D8_9ASCO|nr:hypothetical protein CANARDRAFT_175974 [[Candida] arabinofermentans NRRL YB-2248]